MSDMGLDNILGDMKKTYYASKSDEKRDIKPVSLKKFLYSKEYLNLPFVLSERQYNFLEAMDEDIVRGCRYNEAVLCFGKGSIFSDTIISDAFGNRKTIKEIHDNKEYFQINGLNGRTYKSEIQEAIPPFIEGYGKIMEVITKTGRKIKVWEGHKFLTVNGWVPLNKIKDKASIAMNKSFRIIKNRDDEISDEKLRTMGCLIGNGGNDKFVPDIVFQLSNEKIAHFIAGLWDADGSLSVFKNKFRNNYLEIKYTSKSERLIRDIGELLIRFGIVAKISSKKIKWKNKYGLYWRLRIRNQKDVILFVENIKLQSKRKVESIKLFMENDEIIHRNLKLLPKDVCDKCREIYKLKYKHYRNDGEEGRVKKIFHNCSNFIGGHQRISRNKLKEINNEIKNEEINKILSDDIYWDQIKSVKYIGDDYYYSTTVPAIGTYYAQGFVNKNSGKDNIVAIYFARRAYKLLCMADPQGYFKSQSFELLNVAASEEQCKGVFFKYLTDTFKNAGEKAFKVFGFDPDKDITSDKIKLPKSITCISGHSKAASLEGKNLYCAVLDEVAEFKTEEEIGGKGRHAAMSAAAIYRLCRSSINTRFPGCGKLILISFPRFKKDFIMTKYEQGKNRPNVYCDKAATFEVNPTKKESDFAADLELEPEFTRTAIYCDPPHAKDAFITQTQFIDRIVNEKIKSPYKVGVAGEYKEGFRGTKNDRNKYVISCDLALKNDRAALSMCHKEIYKGRPLYIIDLIKTWEAEPGKIIRLRDIYNEIIILRYRGFNIVQVNFDQYASTQMIQDLIENGFQAQKQSVDKTLDPYLALRNIIYQEALFSYNHPLLLQELKELQLINGIRVDHPSHGCFTGDTKVRLTDGRSLSFLELIDEYKKGKELYTYSVDLEKKLIVPKKINNPRLTIKNAEIIKITLDNDKEIRCTPNHKFMLLDGSYKEAQYLTDNDSLMPLYTHVSNKGLLGYEIIYSPFDNKKHYTHRYFSGKLKKGLIVHHNDFNKLNNSPNNLKIVTKSEHISIHNRERSIEEKKRKSNSLKKWHKENKGSKKYKERSNNISKLIIEKLKKDGKFIKKNVYEILFDLNLLVSKANIRKYVDENIEMLSKINLNNINSLKVIKEDLLKFQKKKDEQYRKKLSNRHNNKEYHEKIMKALKIGYKKNKEKQKIAAQKYFKKNKDKVLNRFKKAIENRETVNYGHDNGRYRKDININSIKEAFIQSEKKQLKEIMKILNCGERVIRNRIMNIGFNTYSEYKKNIIINHKIKSIEKSGFEDVYDITIDGTHNFALDTGVFVHNSKDSADATCSSIYTLSTMPEYSHAASVSTF